MIGQTLGNYRIVEKLGVGGMGVVYRAHDPSLDRDVAIKLLAHEFSTDNELLARFMREARSASALNHPNIITIHHIGVQDNTPYIVMELVQGKSLQDMLKAGPLPTHVLFRLAKQVADGLARAHEAGILHRDLKPGNVMVTADLLAKILDFGLAKQVKELSASQVSTQEMLRTQTGVIMGTASYMSPEQASGLPMDFRSDQFSLGALFYEMATGVPPFRRQLTWETMHAVVHEEPEPMQRLNPGIGRAFELLVERCMSKNPALRFSDTRKIAFELEHLEFTGIAGLLGLTRSPDVSPFQRDSVARNVEVVCHLKGRLDSHYDESTLGSLVADALRARLGADVGVINAGALRGHLPEGPVSSGQVLFALPHHNTLVICKLRGSELRELIEHGLTRERGMVQVSGLHATYDPNRAKGERLVTLNVGGKPVELEQVYAVATISFLAHGGDSCQAFLNAAQEDTGLPVLEVVMDYMRRMGEIDPPRLGRLVSVPEEQGS